MNVDAFAEARTRHQKARTAGMSPDHWYPVERDDAVREGQVVEVVFWQQSIALFRGDDGVLRALDDRCAHRQLQLSKGVVQGCELRCFYHGWSHDGSGAVASVPHDLFGHRMPRSTIGSYPVRVRYGLIWIFPGDPALVAERHIPDIPELDGDRPWPHVLVDVTWRGHHSTIIDNVSDFTHAYLHRKYQPFTESELLRLESDEDRVELTYRTSVARNVAADIVLDPSIDRGRMDLCYVYPYQWSDTGGKIKSWTFVLPVDERTTRTFFVFLFAPDMYRFRLPRLLQRLVLKVMRRTYIEPLLDQDRVAIEAEQVAYEKHGHRPVPELNPAVREMQQLTIRKWADHVGTRRATVPSHRPARDAGGVPEVPRRG